MTPDKQSVYVVIALDGHELRECVVLTDHDAALDLYHHLQKIWGGEFVAMASRKINEIPPNISNVADPLIALLRAAQIRGFTVDLTSAFFSGDVHICLYRLVGGAGAIVEIDLKDAPLSVLLDTAMNTILTFPIDPEIAEHVTEAGT